MNISSCACVPYVHTPLCVSSNNFAGIPEFMYV